MIGSNEPAVGAPLYQLKIVLQYSEPVIWRRIMVPAGIRLDRLHQVIQTVMPWSNSHLHQFVVKGTFYGVSDPDAPDMLEEKGHSLADIAPAAKAQFVYEYDFGDSWAHVVTVEKISPPDAKFKTVVCLEGANACPPDDCGGIPGYYEMVRVLADPKDEEHQNMKQWVGGKWDAGKFDLAKVNKGLMRFKM